MPEIKKNRSLAEVGTFDSETLDFPDIEIGDFGLLWERPRQRPNETEPIIDPERVENRSLKNKVIDLRDFHYFSRAGNQKATKACSAFALAGLIEFYEFDLNGTKNRLSIGWMHKCIGEKDLSKAVSFERLAFDLRGQHIPIVNNEYQWDNTECRRETLIKMFNVQSKGRGAYSDETVRKVIHSRRPIVTSLLVNDNFMTWNSNLPYRCDFSIDYWEHAVVVIGYDKHTWICRNSFGSQWGNNGYFRVGFGDCSLCTGETRIFTFEEPDPLNFV